MDESAFIQYLSVKGIDLSDQQIRQFETYYHFLIEWNQKINLTAITEKDEVYLKHFYDSLIPLWVFDIPENCKLVDVGAGAGFPSIPIKIVRPDIDLTIIDSLNKRINFLDHLIQALDLTGVTAVHSRAEDAGQNPAYREQFDIATARAVAALNVLTELCLPLVRKGGAFLALKGQASSQEIAEADKAIKVLGGKFEEEFIETLPIEDANRSIVYIRKTLDTPKKYPRKAGKPNKQPIL